MTIGKPSPTKKVVKRSHQVSGTTNNDNEDAYERSVRPRPLTIEMALVTIKQRHQ